MSVRHDRVATLVSVLMASEDGVSFKALMEQTCMHKEQLRSYLYAFRNAKPRLAYVKAWVRSDGPNGQTHMLWAWGDAPNAKRTKLTRAAVLKRYAANAAERRKRRATLQDPAAKLLQQTLTQWRSNEGQQSELETVDACGQAD